MATRRQRNLNIVIHIISGMSINAAVKMFGLSKEALLLIVWKTLRNEIPFAFLLRRGYKHGAWSTHNSLDDLKVYAKDICKYLELAKEIPYKPNK